MTSQSRAGKRINELPVGLGGLCEVTTGGRVFTGGSVSTGGPVVPGREEGGTTVPPSSSNAYSE